MNQKEQIIVNLRAAARSLFGDMKYSLECLAEDYVRLEKEQLEAEEIEQMLPYVELIQAKMQGMLTLLKYKDKLSKELIVPGEKKA